MSDTIHSSSMTQLPTFRSGTARVEQGYLKPIPDLTIPFAIIQGAEAGPRLLVTSGVHGAKFCAIETGLRLLKMAPQDIRGTLVVLPLLNVQGFKTRSVAIMPQDGKNLNRTFPGRADGTVSERLAAWLVAEVFPKVDAYLDLHSGDLTEEIVPIAIFPRGSSTSEELAAALGFPMIVEADHRSTTIAAAAQAGIPSVIVEMGGNGRWSDEQVNQYSQRLGHAMAHLGILLSKPSEAKPSVKKVNLRTVAADQEGMWYPAKQLSDTVSAGEKIGEIRDVFRSVLSEIRSEIGGVVLYRLTSLSVTKEETLFGIGELETATTILTDITTATKGA